MATFTILDVAKRADVSPATVSRVMAGSDVVRPATRDRVLAAARDLNYRPLAAARNMRRQGQGGRELRHVIALVQFHRNRLAEEPFAVALMSAMEQALEERGYAIRSLYVSPDGGLPQDISQGQVDGVIARGTAPLLPHIAKRLPLVLIDAVAPELPCYAFIPDYGEGLHQAGLALLPAGFRRIACFTGNPTLPAAPQFTREIARGLGAAATELGLAPHVQYLPIAFNHVEGYRIMVDLLAEPGRAPDLVIAPDAAMLGVYRALGEAGLAIPRDISLLGINGLEVGEYLHPQLTTVDVHLPDLGRRTVAALLDTVEGGVARQGHETTPTSLILRHSARLPD